MFVIIDNTEIGKVTFFTLNNKIVQRDFKVENNKSVLVYLDKFLSKIGLELKDIKYLGVVVGHGSFTSTRLAVTVVNSLAYALKIPAIGVPKNWDAEQVLKNVKETPVGQYISPQYSGEPNIGGKNKK